MIREANRLSRRDLLCRGATFAAAAMVALSPLAVGKSALGEDAKSSALGDCTWKRELCELRAASDATRSYAETKAGVGILIHLGQDIPNDYVKDADQLGRIFVQRFAELGEEARYFVSQNDAPATGITYHVGHLIVGGHDGTEVRDLQHAWDSAPQAVAQVRALRRLASAPSAGLSGGGS